MAGSWEIRGPLKARSDRGRVVDMVVRQWITGSSHAGNPTGRTPGAQVEYWTLEGGELGEELDHVGPNRYRSRETWEVFKIILGGQ